MAYTVHPQGQGSLCRGFADLQATFDALGLRSEILHDSALKLSKFGVNLVLSRPKPGR